MRLTRWVLLVAVAVTLGSAVVWPEEAEQVGRSALLAVGAALVCDLVLSVRRTYPTAGESPFAPSRHRVLPPWRPQGLTELQRDLRLMSVTVSGRRVSQLTRLRETCRSAAQERLRPLGLDLDRAEDRGEARDVLGPGPYDFIVGDAPEASVDELLDALDAEHHVATRHGGTG